MTAYTEPLTSQSWLMFGLWVMLTPPALYLLARYEKIAFLQKWSTLVTVPIPALARFGTIQATYIFTTQQYFLLNLVH